METVNTQTDADELPMEAISLKKPSLYRTLDFKNYLKDFYLHKKSQNRHFSYRIFSEKTGVQSPNYMKLIIEGSRKLTRAHAVRVAKYCGLDPTETRYFIALVSWNQCRYPDEQEFYWNEVLKYRAENPQLKLSNAQLSLLTKWHVVALLELINLKDFSPVPEAINRKLRKPLDSDEILTALRDLEALGIIQKQNGSYKPTHKIIKTEDDLPLACIQNYHRSIIQLALEALTNDSINRREFVSTTLAIRNSDIATLKNEIRKFRDRIMSLSSEPGRAEEVYQFNMQLFALTNGKGKETDD
ncbi:MAG: TIGR02147 family protein [Deltaproteobacteria bacterium]|nr:TIGR02147 family protein [Deltaproteobacteria bacterium]